MRRCRWRSWGILLSYLFKYTFCSSFLLILNDFEHLYFNFILLMPYNFFQRKLIWSFWYFWPKGLILFQPLFCNLLLHFLQVLFSVKGELLEIQFDLLFGLLKDILFLVHTFIKTEAFYRPISFLMLDRWCTSPSSSRKWFKHRLIDDDFRWFCCVILLCVLSICCNICWFHG